MDTSLLRTPRYCGHLAIVDTSLLRTPAFTEISLLRTPRYYGHLAIADTSLLWTPHYYGHLAIADTSLLRTPHYCGHLAIADTSLLRTPHYCGHLAIVDTSLLRTPRYYGHLTIADTSLLWTPRYCGHPLLRKSHYCGHLAIADTRFYGHLTIADTSLLWTPRYCGHPLLRKSHYCGHLAITDTSLLRTPRYYGHLAIADTSLLWTPRYYGHLAIADTSLLWTPRYYGHLAIVDTFTIADGHLRYYEHPLLRKSHYCGHLAIADKKRLLIANETGDQTAEMNAYLRGGDVLYLLKQYNDTVVYCKKCLDIAETIRDKKTVMDACLGLGEALGFLDQDDEAIAYLDRAVVIAKETGSRLGELKAYCLLAASYIFLNQYDKSISIATMAIDIAEETGDKQGEIDACLALASAHKSLNQCDDAIVYGKRCLKIAKEIEDTADEMRACLVLSNAFHTLNQYDDVIVYSKRCVERAKKIGDTRHEMRASLVLSNAFYKLNQCDDAIVYDSFLKQLHHDKEIFSVSDDLKIVVFDAMVSCHKMLSEILIQSGNHKEALLRLEHCRGRILMERLIAKSGMALDHATSEIPNLHHADIESLVSVKKYSIVFYFVGSKSLHTFFAEDEKVMQFSTQNLENCEKTIQLLVEQSYCDMKVSREVNYQATKPAVMKKLREGVSIIHIAAHGFLEKSTIVLAPSPEVRSKRVPVEVDYMLTMDDVQKAQVRAQLVLLSCCNSGRGEVRAEGVIGMCRAFLVSGARAVVASLWSIDDDATLEFMTWFYLNLIKGYSVVGYVLYTFVFANTSVVLTFVTLVVVQVRLRSSSSSRVMGCVATGEQGNAAAQKKSILREKRITKTFMFVLVAFATCYFPSCIIIYVMNFSWANLGTMLSGRGKVQEAEKAYRKALTYRSNMADTHYNLGVLLTDQKRYQDAVTCYQYAIAYRPTLALHKIKYNLGRILADMGKLQDAFAVYHDAVRTLPDHVEPHSLYNMIGEAYNKAGLKDEAEKWYKKSIQSKPDHNRLQEALQLFQRAQQLQPNEHSVWTHFGQFLYERRNIAEAADMFVKASELKAQDFDIIFTAANYLRHLYKTHPSMTDTSIGRTPR
ncbi:hypothetical protein QZH41_001492 [Actinostola sp. cb2023]|nr:hypothetical protein QZH41_001492 [Actinostola sp. cb2023]